MPMMAVLSSKARLCNDKDAAASRLMGDEIVVSILAAAARVLHALILGMPDDKFWEHGINIHVRFY